MIEANREGTFRPGFTPGGDTNVLIELYPSDSQFAGSPMLVVFKGCGEDPVTPNRPILNLEEVLKNPQADVRRPSEWEDPGPRWRVCPSDFAFLLEDGQPRQFSVSVDFLRANSEGLSPRLNGEVHLLSEDEIERLDRESGIGSQWPGLVGRRSPAAHITIDLYYRLSAQTSRFSYGSYGDIFGRPDPNPVENARSTGDYLGEAGDLAVDLLAFRSNLRIPAQVHDDGGALFSHTLSRAASEGSGLVGQPFFDREDFGLGQGPRPHGRAPGLDAGPSPARLADGTGLALGRFGSPSGIFLPGGPKPKVGIGTYFLSGRFSTKWSQDHSLHPGFGFRVEAWSNDFLGIWVRLASDWVQSDGTWNLTVPPTPFFFGGRLRMLYVTRTDYYDAQDINGNHYVWADPDWLNVPFTFSTGHRFADTDGGTFNGVGEMVDAAMYTWSRLYWNGGINPVRSSPINLIAPNTSDSCDPGKNPPSAPWSCANGGNIWLIAAHAAQAQVVSHELSHQLNFKFWNDKKPKNNGGSHNLNTCYSDRLGMTLFEGFADFMAGWVGYPGRNVADGGFGSGRWTLGWDLESRTAPPNCTNGWENETWVARTFWDLHDTRSDGNDILWFNFLGAVPALYLGNGVANNGDARDMRDYENIYRNAASPGHQTFISDIFDQNRH